jgi:hypothetical protein
MLVGAGRVGLHRVTRPSPPRRASPRDFSKGALTLLATASLSAVCSERTPKATVSGQVLGRVAGVQPLDE